MTAPEVTYFSKCSFLQSGHFFQLIDFELTHFRSDQSLNSNFRGDRFFKWALFEVTYSSKWPTSSWPIFWSSNFGNEIGTVKIREIIQVSHFRSDSFFKWVFFRCDLFSKWSILKRLLFEVTSMKVLRDRCSNRYYVSYISCGQKISKIFFSRNFTGCSKTYKRVKNCGEFGSTESITKL